MAAVTAISTRKPLVVTVHVGAIPYRNRFVRKTMAACLALTGRLLLTRAAAVAFVSERVQAEFLARWKMRRQLLIPNGVDLELFKPVAQKDRERVRRDLDLGDRRMVLFVGRFVERKGLHLLHELATRLPSVEWVFAGRGPIDPDSWRLANVHVELIYGEEPHHIAEAVFKGLGRALDAATQVEPRASNLLASTKGSL